MGQQVWVSARGRERRCRKGFHGDHPSICSTRRGNWYFPTGVSLLVSEYRALPDLDANANAVAIQHIKLEHEGWQRDTSVLEPPEPGFGSGEGLD